MSIEDNTLFPLFHQIKKGIHDAVQPLSIRILTDSRQNPQYFPFPSVDFQPPGMPIICRFIPGLNDRYWPKALVPSSTMNGCYRGIAWLSGKSF